MLRNFRYSIYNYMYKCAKYRLKKFLKISAEIKKKVKEKKKSRNRCDCTCYYMLIV